MCISNLMFINYIDPYSIDNLKLYIKRTWLICVLNKFIFGKKLLRIEKIIKISSIFNKLFSKLVYMPSKIHVKIFRYK